MKKDIKYILLFAIAASIVISACKKTPYSFGKILTPSNIVINTTIQGASSNATGDGSGNITISVSSANARAYKIYFGDGDSVFTTTGLASYKYTKLDTNLYTITVNAIGTGGAISTLSKQVKVLYQFQIPVDIISNLTNGSSKSWILDSQTTGHFGVGPSSTFSPDYYAASPGSRASFSCSYTGVVTFNIVGSNGISMNDNNSGSTFLIAAATGFYGQAGGDGCYVLNTGGTKPLGFSLANTGSSASNSTGIQFSVPGNGLVDFGMGATSYEILSLSSTSMALRCIGADGNAWYQIFKAQ